MKLAVATKPTFFVEEDKIITRLFEEGLDYEIAYRPKKAAQYGTGIDKILRKKIIKDTDISQYL